MSQLFFLAISIFGLVCGQTTAATSPTGDACVANDGDASHLYLLQTDVQVTRMEPSGHAKLPGDLFSGPSLGSRIEEEANKLVFGEPTTTTTTTTPLVAPSSGAAASGVSMNAEGDLEVALSALMTNIMMVLFCVGFFMLARSMYPMMYSNNATTGAAPGALYPGWFGWLQASRSLTIDAVASSPIGLDQAMLLEFTHLCMKTVLLFGTPLLLIMGPMHYFFGGNAAGKDYLSYLSMGNVENGSWLYWIHALVIWGVVLAVQSSIYKAQERFLQLRYRWLENLPAPRSTTLLVEGIPPEVRTDEGLKAFFGKMFGQNKVQKAYVVKQTSALKALVTSVEAEKRELAKAEHLEQNGKTSRISSDVYKRRIEEMMVEVKKLQAEVVANAANGESNAPNGFVTFAQRTDAELASSLQYGPDSNEWVMDIPPSPTSVIWSDLMQDDTKRTSFTLLGYGLVAGLYMAYLPLVIGITTIAIRINMGPLQPMWAAFAPTLGLQFMVAFLPTFLINIFNFCFTLKDSAWAQRSLQNWYFVFQVVFVIMITAIGSSVEEFMKLIVTEPFAVFNLLAETMPYATHFYMNFLMLQWASHAMNFTRYIPLTKFVIFSRVYDTEQARAMSEPEDQDYYGIGSRSARFTINMCIGIIFSTLSPPIALLTFINFVICRVVYGYLIPFAETPKPDLGGSFWVGQLEHLFFGNMIYCVMMTGVLYGRAATGAPAFIAAPSLFYVIWSMKRFRTAFSWEKLPYPRLMELSGKASEKKDIGSYVQPEMLYGVEGAEPRKWW